MYRISHDYCLIQPTWKMKASYTVFWLGVFVDISEFVSTPTSVNATLGSTATFSCSATTGVIVWLVNGSELSQLSVSDIKASQVGSTFFLHVPAKVEYNITLVTCILVIYGGDDLYCDQVALMVQGIHLRKYTQRLAAAGFSSSCTAFVLQYGLALCMHVLGMDFAVNK